jgi:formylglycine-generating enzyme required for sulfatase activity
MATQRTVPSWAWLALAGAAAAVALFHGPPMRGSAERTTPPGEVETARVSGLTKTPAFEATVPNDAVAPGPARAGTVWIPGGEFSMGAAEPMGSDMNDVGMHATDDSRPIHRVSVDGFWMDRTELTNGEFEAFVKATGYITVAEHAPTTTEFPDASPESLVAGFGGLLAAWTPCAARLTPSMVELREGRELAASTWCQQHNHRQARCSCRSHRI